VLAGSVDRRLEEVDVVDARNLDRILEAEEHALARPLLGSERQKIASLIAHGARSDLVARTPGQHVRERALAGAVRAHDGMHLAGGDLERQALQDFLAVHFDVQVVDLQHVFTFF